MSRAKPLVSPELAAFLESGLALVVGTTSAALRPDCAFGAGLRVHPDGCTVTLFLGTEPAATAIENLRANGAVAITASRPQDYRTFQLKGRAVRIEPVAQTERGVLLAYRQALVGQLEAVGWSPRLTRRLAVWPCVAVEVQVSAVYHQAPGPRAGAPVEPP